MTNGKQYKEPMVRLDGDELTTEAHKKEQTTEFVYLGGLKMADEQCTRGKKVALAMLGILCRM